MVRITEELIRKKSEHNELIINTLEEISLHQEDIEKIEHIQNWCRDLKILLLQSNLIWKIENLHKLKKLEYLNLAINNIEKIENLEQLESLNKLDLTLNFIGELTGVESLSDNYNLRHLILTGNPCTDYPGYREYVIMVLPQLETLDGQEIKISDRIKAKRVFHKHREKIIQAEAQYKIKRDEQKIRVNQNKLKWAEEIKDLDEDEQNKLFWDTKSEHCPETRCDISRQHRKVRNTDKEERKKKKQPKLFAPCGRPYNLNQAKFEFQFQDEADRYELNLGIYKFLDTSLIDVDVQPNYVRVIVRGKYFQIALNEDVRTSEAVSKRSMITGHLLIIMPKVQTNEKLIPLRKKQTGSEVTNLKAANGKGNESNLKGTVNYKNIVKPTEKQLATTSSLSSSLSPKVSDEMAELPDLV